MSAPEPPGNGTDPSLGRLPPPVYERMALVLLFGLLVALGLFAGGLIALLERASGTSAGGWVSPNPLDRDLVLTRFVHGLAQGSPTAYLTLGAYALIATPVLRVVAGTAAFYAHDERRMAALAAVVLVMLLVGLLVLGPLVR